MSALSPTRCVRGALRRAFTLIELLVVIALIVIVIAVTVPAVGRIIESANYSAAINTVTATLGNARATAMQRQKHTGVAFLFDTQTQRYTLLPLELLTGSGSLGPNTTTGSGRSANALAMRPALNAAPVLLPRGTGVYGLSQSIVSEMDPAIEPAPLRTWGWYAGEVINETNVSERVIPWLFPRNDPRLFLREGQDPWFAPGGMGTIDTATSKRIARRHADTFCVIFSPEGSVVGRLELGEGQGFAGAVDYAYIEYPDLPSRVDPATGRRQVVDDPGAFDPELGVNPPAGLTTNPEVKLRTAELLAVVDLGRLVTGTGVDRPWLMRAVTSKAPPFVDSAGAPVPGDDEAVRRISEWIDSNAEVIAFDRYTGSVLRR